MRFNSRNIWMSSRDYVLIIFGLCIYAFGFTAFVLPERVVIGDRKSTRLNSSH